MNKEQLQKEYPQIYDSVYQDGVTAERSRMQALDELAVEGSTEIINKARYETGDAPEAVAMQIVKAMKTTSVNVVENISAEQMEHLKALNARMQDALSSGVNAVPAGVLPENPADDRAANIAACANKIRGRNNK